MSEVLNKKGYLLNAITLLFEAIGSYCNEGIEKINPTIESYVREFKNSDIFNHYDLINQSRNLVKVGIKMNSYLFGIEKARKHFEFSEQKSREYLSEIKRLIVKEIEKAQNIKEFREFIVDAERLRNNLAHGNSSE